MDIKLLKKKNHSVSTKYRISSGIYIAIFVLILIVINLMASIFDYQFDFSSEKTYSLSGEFKNMLDTVDKEVEIIACHDRIFYTGNTYLSNIAETIENMAAYTDNITYSFKSVDKNPEIAKDYPTSGISTTSVIIRLKDDITKYKIISVNDMFDGEEDSEGNTTITESKVEYVLASAIDFVCRDEFPTVYVTTNHIEDSPSEYLSLLTGNNYSVNTYNLLAKDIPEDADYIMIFNPKTDFTDLEIQRLEAFLQNNGNLNKNLFVYMSPSQPDLPNLEKFLNEWGISVDDGYLYNTTYSTNTEKYDPMLVEFGDVNAAGSLYKTVSILSENTRPLSTVFTQRDYASTTVLLKCANFTQLVENTDNEPNPEEDNVSTSPIMVVGTKTQAGVEGKSNVVVCGSYDIVSDTFMASSSGVGNSTYMMQIVGYMDQESNNIYIFPKSMETPLLTFSSSSAKTVCFIVFAVLIPVAIAVVGTVIFLRRRHL